MSSAPERADHPHVAQQTFHIKQGDLAPRLDFTLLDDTTPIDLTLAVAARLHMRNLLAGLKVDAPVLLAADQAVDTGKGSYHWIAGDTDTPGTYRAEIEVTWADGRIQTFPADGYFTVKVVRELDAALVTGTGVITAVADLTAA